MSAAVTQESLGGGYVAVSFEGSVVLVLDEARGCFNPAQLCQQACKEVRRYNELARKQDLEIVLNKYCRMVCYKVDGDRMDDPMIAGWYFHPTLLLDLALWVSAEAFTAVAIIVAEVFFRRKSRMPMLSDLLKCGGMPDCRKISSRPTKWLIRLTRLDVTVNERGWFDAAQFCATHNKRLSNFEVLADPGQLIKLMASRNLMDNHYYHPLLFLRLAAWVNLDYFVKCVRIVFCSGDKSLDSQFRKACKQLGCFASLPSGSSGQLVLPKSRAKWDTGSESTDEESDEDEVPIAERRPNLFQLQRQPQEAPRRERVIEVVRARIFERF